MRDIIAISYDELVDGSSAIMLRACAVSVTARINSAAVPRDCYASDGQDAVQWT